MTKTINSHEFGLPPGRFRVYSQKCDYGKFQAFHMPCQNVIADCAHVHVDQCVSLYRLQNVFNVYNHSFGILPNESLWPENPGDECCHDPKNQRNLGGHPKTRHIRIKMDMRERGQPKRCSICQTISHSKSKCPNNPREA